MDIITIIVLIFSVLGALDYILGNRFGLGREYEKGFMLLGTMALTMIGMIIISPLLANIMRPFFDFVSNTLHVDASIIPASLFANDMGGAPLALELAHNEKIGFFNGLVVSSMMGCTISFTIPFALGMVGKQHHRELLLGLLCGIVTIPLGCFVSGIMCDIPLLDLIINLLPLVCFSAIIAVGLVLFPEMCVKIFSVFGVIIKIIIIIGLTLGIIRFLTGKEIVQGLATIEEGAAVCLNASIVMTGAFPFMHIVSKLLAKPLGVLSKKVGINDVSAVGVIASLATSATTYGMMDKMDKKGIMINSAFAVSGAFVFASHLAFTMAFNEEYVLPVIVGKLVSGAFALLVSGIIYEKVNKAKSL